MTSMLLLGLFLVMIEVSSYNATNDPIGFYEVKLLNSNCSKVHQCTNTYSFCFENSWHINCVSSKKISLQPMGNCLQNTTKANGSVITDVKRSELEKGVVFTDFDKEISALGNMVMFLSNIQYPACELNNNTRNITDNKIIFKLQGSDQNHSSLSVQIKVVCKDKFCSGLKCDKCGKPPIVTITPSAYSPFKGQNVTILCAVSTHIYPLQHLEWIFTNEVGHSLTINSTVDPGKYVLSFNESTLTINNLISTDIGKYHCTAQNEVGTTNEFIMINVTGSNPEVEIYTQTIYSAFGSNVTIPCNITAADPEVTKIHWTRNQNKNVKVIDMLNPRYHGSTVDTPSLVIYNVTQADNGGYTCHAENPVGSGSSNQTTITIIGAPPIVKIPIKSYTEYSGNSKTIMCEISSPDSKVTHIEWIFINQQGKTIDPVNISTVKPLKYSGSSIENPSLTIHNLNESDKGTYKCRVENTVGSSTSNPATLEVMKRHTTLIVSSTESSSKYIHTETKTVGTVYASSNGKPVTTGVVMTEPPSSSTPYVTDIFTSSPIISTTFRSSPIGSSKLNQHTSQSVTPTRKTYTKGNPGTPEVVVSSTPFPTEKSTVLATPTVSREKSTDDKKIPIIAGASGGGLVLIIAIVVTIKMCMSRKSSSEPNQEMHHF